jgi:hypothetical protein
MVGPSLYSIVFIFKVLEGVTKESLSLSPNPPCGESKSLNLLPYRLLVMQQPIREANRLFGDSGKDSSSKP